MRQPAHGLWPEPADSFEAAPGRFGGKVTDYWLGAATNIITITTDTL